MYLKTAEERGAVALNTTWFMGSLIYKALRHLRNPVFCKMYDFNAGFKCNMLQVEGKSPDSVMKTQGQDRQLPSGLELNPGRVGESV